MAITVTIVDKKRLAVGPGADTSEGMAIVNADIALGNQSDYNSTSGIGGAAVAASSFGLASIIALLGNTVRASGTGSDGSAKGLLAVYDQFNSQLKLFLGPAGAAYSSNQQFAPARSGQITNGDVVRVVLLGTTTSQAG